MHKDKYLYILGTRYFNKSNKTLTQKDVDNYTAVISKIVDSFLGKRSGMFGTLGWHRDDLKSIGLVHLTSYLSLFSIEADSKKMDKLKKEYGDTIPESVLLENNKKLFASFLKQRLNENFTRNIEKELEGVPLNMDKIVAIVTPGTKDDEIRDAYFKKAKSKDIEFIKPSMFSSKYGAAKKINKNTKVAENGKYVTKVALNTFIPSYQIEDHFYSKKNTPEDILMELEDQIRDIDLKKSFESRSELKQRTLLRSFLEKNSNNPHLKEEVALARKKLLKKA